MESLQPEARAASGDLAAPQTVPDAASAFTGAMPPFTATRRETIAALLFYVLGYLYFDTFFELLDDAVTLRVRIVLSIFTLGFLAVTELLHRETPRSAESNVWLFGVLSCLYYVAMRQGHALEPRLPLLCMHIFAVWWVLSRGNALLEGRSGRFLPLDALDGFVIFPFSNLFLRARTVKYALSCRRSRDRAVGVETVAFTALACLLALSLFAAATRLLIQADRGFSALLSGLVDWYERFFTFRPGRILSRFLLSLPFGAYLYGLIDGAHRQDKEALRRRAGAVDQQMAVLRAVPNGVWFLLLALFCVLYVLFFVIQGRYLFGAFTRTLPTGFIVSRYAREGFFELCRVMAVNFALLYLVTRSARGGVRRDGKLLALCLVLIAESFLLAVVAFSKLALYISCFGFTPLRLQSAWLVCVLAFGCLCAAASLLREKETMRLWMYFGALSFSLLCYV